MPSVVWKGFASFGLVSFPVRLFAAARAKRLGAHLLHKKDHSRVKEVWYCVDEEKPIQRSEMVKGYETAKGSYVVVEEEELKKIAPPTARMLEIVQFVTSEEVDPILNAANRGSKKAPAKPAGKELEMAKTLIEHLAGPFKPESFHDSYRENFERLIDEKKKGKKITKVPQPKRPAATDLMAALERSLAQFKTKPAKTPQKRKAA